MITKVRLLLLAALGTAALGACVSVPDNSSDPARTVATTALPAPQPQQQPAKADPHPDASAATSSARTVGEADGGRWTGRDWAALISGFGGILGFVAALSAMWLAHRSNRANLVQKSNEAEMTSIETKLDDFFGPYLRLSQTNGLLHGELRRRQASPDTFRVLLLLLDPAWRDTTSAADRTLVDEIIRIDRELELLIKKAGRMNAAIQPYLARASAHFRMIRLAHKGRLEDDAGRFARFVYPRVLDQVLELEVRRLQERVTAMRQDPGRPAPPEPDLVIPDDLLLDPWPAA